MTGKKQKGASMKSDYVIYGALIVVVMILGYTARDLISENPTPQNSQNVQAQTLTKTTGSTSQGDVQIDLTPIGIVNGKFAVSIAVNTHSVTLSDYDLAKITTLAYNGRKYAPISSPAMEGHHNNGNLVFDLNQAPSNFKIVIVGIPSVQERVFEWK